MRPVFTFIVLYMIAAPCVLRAQKYELTFLPVFGDVKLDSAEIPWPAENDTLKISTCKCYISGIALLYKGETVWIEKNSFHLVDFRKTSTSKIILDLEERIAFDQLCFNFGIDSVTNVSGVLGGDLDPTIGMYWAWQSGYINFKLEGRSHQVPGSNFVFHLGGYAYPNNSLNRVTLPAKSITGTQVLMDVEQFLKKVDLKLHRPVMSPGGEAKRLSLLATEMFRIKQE